MQNATLAQKLLQLLWRELKLITAGLLLFMLGATGLFFYMTAMPGRSFTGTPAALDEAGLDLAKRLRGHVETLCRYPNRTFPADGLRAAQEYIQAEFERYGYEAQAFPYSDAGDTFINLTAFKAGLGADAKVLVVGAHYDTVSFSPGANDNASGVAVLLELARLLRSVETRHGIHFVAFANEEPPYFRTEAMGSRVYAQKLKAEQKQVLGMISLETLGYYSSAPGSQVYPPPLDLYYPDRGDFIAFVGNLVSRDFVREAVKVFRRHTQLPSQGIAALPIIPRVDWSDHASFWEQDMPAFMLTDTAPNRYPYYHDAQDTPDKLDYQNMSRLTAGLREVLAALACTEAGQRFC